MKATWRERVRTALGLTRAVVSSVSCWKMLLQWRTPARLPIGLGVRGEWLWPRKTAKPQTVQMAGMSIYVMMWWPGSLCDRTRVEYSVFGGPLRRRTSVETKIKLLPPDCHSEYIVTLPGPIPRAQLNSSAT